MNARAIRGTNGSDAPQNERPHAQKQQLGRGNARGPLGVRIALVVAALMLAAVAAVAVVNLAATMRFNQATASLTANIKAAQDPSTDVDTLSARQQQTDAQFAEAGRMRALLMPQVRDAIDANTAVSSQLTTITLKQAQLQQDGAGASDATNGQTASGTSGSRNRKQSDGLTEEQRKKVEELMKANQQAAEDQSAMTTNKTEQQATQNKGTGATKPW